MKEIDTERKENHGSDGSKESAGRGGRRVWSMVFKILIPAVITVGLCWLLFSTIDFDEMMTIIRSQCDYRWLLLMMAISILSHVFRAMRWRLQLRAIGVDPPLFALVLSIFGTYAVNLVFPRLGELWRTGYISQRQNAPFDKVFGSMVADRLTDTLTVALLTLVTFIVAGGPMVDFLREGGASTTVDKVMSMLSSPWLYVAALAALGVAWAIFHFYSHSRIVGKIVGFCRGLWHGFSVVAVMPGRVQFLLLTVGIWGCYYLQMYVAFFSFPLTAEVVARFGAGAVLMCFVLSSISMVIPSNGGIGPWQWAVVFALSIYSSGIDGLTRDYATAFANMVMGTQTLLLIVLGIFTFVCIALGRRKATSKK
ncbi:MAG: flippase-like domain-containing protein [Bacteroides sp.]|nr:flippase-like domain-containing protein [Bacteroides sp.]MCM1413532.1 flippase-like domain-containing protein [Bacteroides sp.]MCM1471086.1 flippase-like domain-containing protein [Bacteroides sp.]